MTVNCDRSLPSKQTCALDGPLARMNTNPVIFRAQRNPPIRLPNLRIRAPPKSGEPILFIVAFDMSPALSGRCHKPTQKRARNSSGRRHKNLLDCAAVQEIEAIAQ